MMYLYLARCPCYNRERTPDGLGGHRIYVFYPAEGGFMIKKIRDRLTGWRLWALFACGAVFLASGALLVRDLAQ